MPPPPPKNIESNTAKDADRTTDESPEISTSANPASENPVPATDTAEEAPALIIESPDIGTADEAPAPIIEPSDIVAVPQAKSVDLGQPVEEPLQPPQENLIAPVIDVEPAVEVTEESSPAISKEGTQPPPVKHLVVLGAEVPPATSTRLSWGLNQSFEGIANPTPVLIVNGAEPGPTLCLTAAIHGDELNGIEIVRRILYNIDVEALSGTVIGVPIVNLQGFHRSSRYLTDRRDLNRFFPGNTDGSSASRIAHSFFNDVISHCDALVDLHTGSFHRTNLPQLRANLSDPGVRKLTQGFGATVVLNSEGAEGTLRRAAVDAGIPAVTLEAGAPMQLQEEAVSHGVKGIRTLLNKMDMVSKISLWGDPEPIYYGSIWVRADRGGILFSNVELGDDVDTGDVLGVVTNPITNVKREIVSPHDGQVLGMALNQVVMPGFAAFHIGISAPEEEIIATSTTSDDSKASGEANTAPVSTPASYLEQDDTEIDVIISGEETDFD